MTGSNNGTAAEARPEVAITLGERNGFTEVDTDMPSGEGYVAELQIVIGDVVEAGFARWYRQPTEVLHEDPETGEPRVRFLFRQTNHFGTYRNLYGENAGKILRGLLERDGISVSMNGKVKELELPTIEEKRVPTR